MKLNTQEMELQELTNNDIVNFLSSFEDINQLPTIEQIYDFIKENYSDNEVFFDKRMDGFIFYLKDNTQCKLSYWEHQCILHSYKDRQYEEAGEWIYIVGDIFICASCLTILKSKPDILKKYDCFYDEYNNESEIVLLPKSWDDEQIELWCKKRQQNEDNYSKKNLSRQLSKQCEHESLNIGCSTCIYMKHGECELNLDGYIEDNQQYCDEYETK